MHAFAAAGAGFLIAVLWFDLMFDVQIAGRRDAAAPEALASVAFYYRRVTTEARPMNSLVALVMLLTLVAIGVEIARGEDPIWLPIASLAVAGSAIGLALGRTVRNAVELGRGQGAVAERVRLARAIYRDHLYCLFAMGVVLALQLAF